MEDSQEIEENAKIYKMTLLYTQTKYLYAKYNKEMTLSPEMYYLVDKKWLDDYKQKYNYNKIVEKLKDMPGYDDYFQVRYQVGNNYKIDKNQLTTIDVANLIENFLNSEKEVFEEYDLNVPKNIELVLQQFFKDCLNNSPQIGFTKTEVYIGNQTILIVDDERNDVLYCCSLVPNDENNFNFCVKVEYILFSSNPDVQRDIIGDIADLGGLNNYLIKNNIDANKKEEQDIKDNKGVVIGKFLKFEEKKVRKYLIMD